MSEYKLAIIIGRFQPIHNAHLEVIKKALEIADRVLIILGSANSARTSKNPFTIEERKSMISASLAREHERRIDVDAVRDYYYSDNLWVTNVQSIVGKYAALADCDDSEITLVANYKDASSYYLDLFPQWHKTAIWGSSQQDATEIRKTIFNRNCGTNDFKDKIPEGAFEWLCKNFVGTEAHAQLIREQEFIESYKRQWSSSPFPVTFVTADCVVVKSGHVLMVTRKFEPGKGLLALPGGFIKQNERIQDAAIRELKEETRIEIPAPSLKTQIVDSAVFDHPGRSLRGRTITHGFYIDLGKGELPKIKASDDAAKVQWVPLMDLFNRESEIFEDHVHIINRFVNRQY